VAELDVPVPAGLRRPLYTGVLDLDEDPRVVRLLCAGRR
jgi:hypothetical protein